MGRRQRRKRRRRRRKKRRRKKRRKQQKRINKNQWSTDNIWSAVTFPCSGYH